MTTPDPMRICVRFTALNGSTAIANTRGTDGATARNTSEKELSHDRSADDVRPTGDYLRRPRLDPLAMISTNRSLMAFNLIWLLDHVDRLPAAYAALERLAPWPPHVGAVFPFDQAPQALRLLRSGRTIGKVVLQV